jgi:endonuclease IV
MKPTSIILSHIHSLPQFKLLKRHYCYQKFIALLNPRFQQAIAFVYIRDKTLYVALSHPGFKMELNYNKDILKSILSILSQEDTKCANMNVSNVVLFNSKHLSTIKENSISTTIPHYQEVATGNFSIESKDEELIQAFQKIQKSIQS